MNEDGVYRAEVRPVKVELRDFGGLVNMISPVHIRQESLLQTIAEKVIAPRSEREDITATGSVLMTCGAYVKQGFSGTGWDAETRVMGDSGSRLYILEQR